MQIVQSQLGIKSSPLGSNSFLGFANSVLLQKNSSLLHSLNFIKPLTILKSLLAPEDLLMASENSKYLRSWDNFDTALNTDLLRQSTKFKFEDLEKNLGDFNINNIEKPKNIKKSSKKTSNSDSSKKNVTSSDLLNQKNTKSKKQTKAQIKTNSPAKSKKATNKNSAKKIESGVTQRSLNQEQKIASNSPTVIPIPETLTSVGQSNLPNNLTTQTQTTLPTQPNPDSTSTEISVQKAPVLPAVTNSHISDESKPTPIPDVSTTAPATLEEQATLIRQSLNQEQKIAPNSPTVIPITETLTSVGQSNLPNNLTTQIQTTLPTQPNPDSTSTEISVQKAPVLPAVTNSHIRPTPIPDVSTTAPATLEEQATLIRQSLNQEQKIAPNSPTVIPITETLTSVGQSNLPNNLTTQIQTTLPTQPNPDSTSTEISVQKAPVLPAVTNSHISDESKPASIPDVSTTAPATLKEQATLIRQSLNQEQKIAPNSPTVIPITETLTSVGQSNLPNNLTTQTQTTLPTQPNPDSTSTEISVQKAPVLPAVTNSHIRPTPIPDVSTTAPATLEEQAILIRQSFNQEQKIAPNSPTVIPITETLTSVGQSNLPNNLTTQIQTTLPTQPNPDSTSTEISVQKAPVLPAVTNSHISDESKPTPIPDVSTTAPATLEEQATLIRQSLNQEQKIAPNSPTVIPITETLTSVGQSNLPNNLTTQIQTTLPTQPNPDSTSTEISVQKAPVLPAVTNSHISDESKPAPIPDVSTTAPATLEEQATLIRQSLNQEQKIAPNSPTVIPITETLTSVGQSNLPNNLTTQIQTTLPTQPNPDSTSTEISVQKAPVLPAVTNSHISDESKPTPIPDVSTTAPATLEEQAKLIRQSLNQEQKIAPNSPTVIPITETLTSVGQSNLPNNLTTQTQTTLPTQPNPDSTSTEISVQKAPVLPAVTNSHISDESKPTPIPDVSTTAPATLEEQATLIRQSLNQEQKIAPNSPTVIPIPETLTSVGQSNLPNNLTTQTQTTLPTQPNPDSTSTEISVQKAPVLPAVISGVSTTTPSTWRDESTVVQQDPIGDFLNESSPKNPSFDNLPAPIGFATGGQVATTQFQGSQSIAPSDTVSAMLTPGEFVINAQNTHKNLNLLEHINSGGRPENLISPKESPNLQDEGKSALASNHSTHADSSNESLIQRVSLDATLPRTSHTLISSSIGQEIFGKQSFSKPTFIQAYTKENTITKVGKHSEQYLLPNLVFQQPTPATNSPSETVPSQWSSVEELLGGSTNQSTAFDSEPVKSSKGNSKLPTGSKSPKTAIRRKSVFQDFTNEKEVTAPNEVISSNKALPSDIDTEAQPITETIKSFCCSPPTEDKIADEIETLAREIYNRLRQRLEIERERHGNSMYSGRLPW